MPSDFKAQLTEVLVWIYRGCVILIGISLIIQMRSSNFNINVTNWNILINAVIVGAIGSVGYFSALYFGFVSNRDIKESICPPAHICRSKLERIGRVFWFAIMGGAVSAIFQIPEETFVPIQAFVLGATWPTVVTQIISGKQADQKVQPGLKENVLNQIKGKKDI